MKNHKLFLILPFTILLLITGCSNVTDTLINSTKHQHILQSSDNLKRNCEFKIAESMDSFKDEGLEVGTTAIDFTLWDTNGNEVTLSDLLAEKPVVMVLGSFTWPPFRRSCTGNNELFSKYGDSVNFIIVYTIEAHPIGTASPYSDKEWPLNYSTDADGNPISQPLTYDERLDLAKKTIEEQGIDVPILIDEMDNPIWCTYGQAPNIAYLIRTDGRIILKQEWYDPEKMEEFIRAYIITS